MSLRKKVFKIVHPTLNKEDPNILFDGFIIVLIILSILAVILESVPSLRAQYATVFLRFEQFSVAVFSIEYLLRLWTYVEIDEYKNPITGRIKWMLTPMAIIDLLAVLPFYLPFMGVDLRFIRIFRLFRIFRIFKIARYSHALNLFYDVLKKKKEELLITFFFCALLTIFFATIIYYAERESQPEVFGSIPQSMWWAIITLTTVGYGDAFPVTALGKFIASLVAILGIGLFALPTGILAAGFSDALEKLKGKHGSEGSKESNSG